MIQFFSGSEDFLSKMYGCAFAACSFMELAKYEGPTRFPRTARSIPELRNVQSKHRSSPTCCPRASSSHIKENGGQEIFRRKHPELKEYHKIQAFP